MTWWWGHLLSWAQWQSARPQCGRCGFHPWSEDPLDLDEEADYLGVRIQLRRERVGTGAAGFLEWWVIELQDCQANCNLLPMVIFSDKVSPPSLGFLAGYG